MPRSGFGIADGKSICVDDIVTDQRPALVEEPVEIVIDEPKVIGQPEIKINSFELE